MWENKPPLSDDELMEQEAELTRRIVLAARMGKMAMVGELQRIQAALVQERQERLFMRLNPAENDPVVIDTDPLTKPEPMGKSKATSTKGAEIKAARRPMPIPTSHPVTPGENSEDTE